MMLRLPNSFYTERSMGLVLFGGTLGNTSRSGLSSTITHCIGRLFVASQEHCSKNRFQFLCFHHRKLRSTYILSRMQELGFPPSYPTDHHKHKCDSIIYLLKVCHDIYPLKVLQGLHSSAQ